MAEAEYTLKQLAEDYKNVTAKIDRSSNLPPEVTRQMDLYGQYYAHYYQNIAKFEECKKFFASYEEMLEDETMVKLLSEVETYMDYLKKGIFYLSNLCDLYRLAEASSSTPSGPAFTQSWDRLSMALNLLFQYLVPFGASVQRLSMDLYSARHVEFDPNVTRYSP